MSLPREAVEQAIERRDLEALLDLDRRIRDAVPPETPVPEAVAREAVELLTLIANAMRDLGGMVAASDAPSAPLAARVELARDALDRARSGRADDGVQERARAVRARMNGSG